MKSSKQDPAVLAAEKRCTDAHINFERYQLVIDEIITAQDWKTLGYNTFIDYWIDRFGGITARLDLRPRVVYAMLDEGGTNDAIADAVKGIGPEGVANLRRQKAAGVPPESADAMSKPRRAKPAPDRGTKFVHAGVELGDHWDAIAAQRGVSTSDLIIDTMVQVHGRP
jgi:hypothetical protein